MRLQRSHALLTVVALTGLTLTPVAPAFATEVAPPETVTDTVAELPAADDAAASAAAADLDATRPAASAPVRTEVAFSTLGLRLPQGLDELRVRTRDLDGTWREWLDIDRAVPDLDGPDQDTTEATTAAHDVTEPIWVGPSDAFQVVYDAASCGECEVGDGGVEAVLIDTLGLNEGIVARTIRHLKPRQVVAPAEAAAGRPAIISRAGWGANESLRRGTPSYRTPTFAVLHHTAGSNNYTRSQSAAVVRGIYSYHTQALGWSDIGYNVLVDKYGQIFEGRYGGLHRGVVGAHAQGFNSGSFGVSLMGNYDVVDAPKAAIESLARVTAWKYGIHGIDATASRTQTVNGTRINVLTAHRNIGSTACPGRYLYARMGELRSRIAALDAAGSTSTVRFDDVPRTHNQHDEIEFIAVRNITTGCGPRRYCPSNSVTREQMASFLVRATGLERTWWTPFVDVDSSSTHGRDVATIWANQITNGCSPTRFCPRRAVTRAEMASFVSRAFDVPPARSTFPDVRSTSSHADAIGGLVEAGIVKGYADGTYRPDRDVSRAEMAVFLNRAIVWQSTR